MLEGNSLLSELVIQATKYTSRFVHEATGVTIRKRQDQDLEACVSIMAAVRDARGYPLHWPEDPAGWIANYRERQAWVALSQGQTIIGHAAHHAATDDLVARLWCETTGCEEGDLAVVSRLFVHPEYFGTGVGELLLQTVVQNAHQLGKQPVLDTLASATRTIAYYERNGWRQLGIIDVRMPNGDPFEVMAMAGPAPPSG
jgi:GNAT superfamily N-acetyltransferase